MADLNLKFENGKAPALNADNMNKIVNEINRTNAKTKDLQSEIATLVIEKGGSIVQANPAEEPTEKITSIRINEDVFEMASETGIEVTQEVYNAMEAAGEIEADVNYFVKDATTSSDSFAEEISKIKTSLNYIKLGNTDGGNGISLPSGWKEIRVLVARGTSQTYCIPITFTKEEFDNGTRYWQGGFYLSSGNNSCVSVFCNGSSASIGEFYFAGSDAKSSCKAIWYWK